MKLPPLLVAPGSLEPDSALTVEVRDLNHLGVLAAIWDDLDLTALLDHAIGTDPQMTLTPGLAMKCQVLDVLTGRWPMYLLEERWAKHLPLEQLLGTAIRPRDLSDTNLGRSMDRMFRAGCAKVFDAASLRVIVHEKLEVRRPLHLDTTSRVMFGEYASSHRPDVVSITRGYSKDHRPDLLQLMFGLVVDGDGVPVVGRVLDGNTEDKSWFGHLVGNVRGWQRALAEGPLELVGDAALINEPNLQAAAAENIVLTGRLPRTVAACQVVVREALKRPEQWEDIGVMAEAKDAARYQAQRAEREVLGVPMQVGVYRATTSQQRAQRSVARRAERALVQARKEAKALAVIDHHCAVDAAETFEHAQSRLAGSLLRATGEVVTQSKAIHWGRGRPPKNLQGPREEVHRVKLSFAIDAAAVDAQARDEGCFVVIHTGKTPLSATDILRRYKGQATIEKRFPFIKDPAWTDAFFVKTPEHVEALGYILLLALLLWAVWERRVRRNLAASGGKPLREPAGIKHARPTAQACTHILDGMRLVRVVQGSLATPWRLAGAMTPEQARLVRLSGRCGSVAPAGP